MKVKCVDTRGLDWLTIGKEYFVFRNNDNNYEIVIDYGYRFPAHKSSFIEIE